jgi:predicted AAA+ superfamily ATPase
MKRDIEKDLLRWKESKGKMPLLLRGARQVGKSYIVEKFAKENFKNFIVLNFEQHPEYKQCFESLETEKIINAIELLTGKSIRDGETLLFFDEIQECPAAIMAMRYFKEEKPDLHLIGAGSLLEFALNDPSFRMPVGRVQFLYLRPLSFGEFLGSSGHENLRNYLHTLTLEQIPQEVIHQKLLALLREYFALGGMPAVIAEYLKTKSLLQIQELQTGLLLTFRNDFGKYAHRMPHTHLQTIFNKAPALIAKHLKYSTLDPDTPARTLKNALQKLADAGLIILIHPTSAEGLPLIAHMNEKKTKLLFLDVGLVKRACNLDLELLFKEDLSLINEGALAEQFVGQELLAYFGKEEQNTLFFWTRQDKGGSAEVDYLIHVDSRIVPIEVKSGAIGKLRSLKFLLNEKKIPLGIRISENPLSFKENILSIPLYLVEELPRLTKEIYKILENRAKVLS